MKNIFTLVAILSLSLLNAQVFKGKGDVKGQIGLTLQDGGTGIGISTDFGIGENMSIGFVAGYMLNADKILDLKPSFEDRVDFRASFNANIGNVLKIDDNIDVYPGISLGLRNLGGHIGIRYFFTDGFGVYSEGSIPLAKYDTGEKIFGHYNNQFVFAIGTSFNF